MQFVYNDTSMYRYIYGLHIHTFTSHDHTHATCQAHIHRTMQGAIRYTAYTTLLIMHVENFICFANDNSFEKLELASIA